MKLELRPFENTESEKQSEKEWKKQRGPKGFSVYCEANKHMCHEIKEGRKERRRKAGGGGEEWGTQERREGMPQEGLLVEMIENITKFPFGYTKLSKC